MKTLDSVAILIPMSFAAIVMLAVFKTPNEKNVIDIKASPVTTPVPTISTIDEVDNPDGNKRLSIIKSFSQEGSYNYDLKVTDLTKNTSRIIYRENLPNGYSFTAPKNSWSNDNTKFFIEKNTPQEKKYYVFKEDGSTFKDGLTYIDVGSYWENAKRSLNIKTLTGWADEDLIIVYTSNNNGEDGPSFWFVISSRKFMQLADRQTD